MRILCVIVVTLFLATGCHGGEALGIKYDAVYLVRLKHPDASRNKAKLFDADGKPSSVVEGAYLVPRAMHPSIDKLFHEDAEFDNGKADSRLQLYSLVYYKAQNCVLSISPNLLGGDLYASDVTDYDPRSLSRAQRNQFLEIVLRSLGSLGKSVQLPPKTSNAQ